MKKKIFAALAVLCLLAGSGAFAQEKKMMPKERPTAEQIAQRRTEKMTEQLKLSEAQAKQVYDLNLQQAQNMQTRHEQSASERKAWADKVDGVLTPEQQQAWKQHQLQRRENMKAKRGQQDKSCKGSQCDKQMPANAGAQTAK